jgi:hypothetical protein
MGPDVVWFHLSMDGRVTVTVPNTDFIFILISLFLDCIGLCSIFNHKLGVYSLELITYLEENPHYFDDDNRLHGFP